MASRRIFPKVLAALVALVVVTAAGAYLYWQSYLHSPQHSLAMLAHAVATRDWPGVQKYVDVKAVVDAGVEQEIAKTVGGKNGALPGMARTIAEAGKPTVTRIATEALQEAVQQKRDWGAPAANEFAGILAVSSATRADVSGDTARVTVTAPRDIGAMRFTMKQTGDHWRIVQVDDAIDLITRVTNLTGVGSSGHPKPRFDLNDLSAAQVIEALKAIGIPIGQVQYLDAARDPEHLLGRGGLRQKAVWAETENGDLDLANPDGSVEIFGTPELAASRLRSLRASARQAEPGEVELTYPVGNALIRVGGRMTPQRAAAYQRVFENLR